MCESRVSIPGFNATRVPRKKKDIFLLASRSKPIINIDRIAQVAQTQSSVTEGLPVPRAVQHYSLFNGGQPAVAGLGSRGSSLMLCPTLNEAYLGLNDVRGLF